MNYRIRELDILRIMGFLLVVDQHILGAYAGRPKASFFDSMILNFLYLIGRPAVPMFVAITAITLFYTSYKGFNLKKFYSKKLLYIATPYVVWSFIYIAVFKKFHLLADLPLVLLTGMSSYHLWYMGMIIRVYIWFPFILYAAKKAVPLNLTVKRICLAAFLILYWLILKYNSHITAYAAELIFKTPTDLQRRFVMYCPVFWSVYFVLGALIIHNYESFKGLIIKNKRMISGVYFILLVYMYYTQVCAKLPEGFPVIKYEHSLYILYMLSSILLMYIIALQLSEKLLKYQGFLEALGSLSFTAYLVHVIFLQRIAAIQTKYFPINSYLASGLLIFITTTAASFILCWLLSFVPYSNIIFGVKHRQITFPSFPSMKGSLSE